MRRLEHSRSSSLVRKSARNLQCAQDSVLYGPLDLITIDDDVAIQTGAYIQPTRWSGQYFWVGPVHLESRCKIGMRATVSNNVTIGSGTWITPFTPILSNVGPHEVGRELRRGLPAAVPSYGARLRLASTLCPSGCSRALNVLMQIVIAFSLNAVPVAIILWLVAAYFLPAEMSTFGIDLSPGPFLELVWHLTLYTFITTWVAIVVSSVLGMPLHSFHGRLTRTVPVARVQGNSFAVQNAQNERDPTAVDMDHHWPIPACLAGMRLPRWRVRVRRNVQPGTRTRHR